MDMFRHHDVPEDVESIRTMCPLQRVFKDIARERSAKISEPLVTSQRYKV